MMNEPIQETATPAATPGASGPSAIPGPGPGGMDAASMIAMLGQGDPPRATVV